MLNELMKEIHENAKAHGWWDEERSFGEIIALCHSELSEALEEYRNDKPSRYFVEHTYDFDTRTFFPSICTDFTRYENEKPEGIAIELADCIIRILDYCAYADINIDEAINIKHAYNKTRSYKHGGKVM